MGKGSGSCARPAMAFGLPDGASAFEVEADSVVVDEETRIHVITGTRTFTTLIHRYGSEERAYAILRSLQEEGLVNMRESIKVERTVNGVDTRRYVDYWLTPSGARIHEEEMAKRAKDVQAEKRQSVKQAIESFNYLETEIFLLLGERRGVPQNVDHIRRDYITHIIGAPQKEVDAAISRLVADHVVSPKSFYNSWTRRPMRHFTLSDVAERRLGALQRRAAKDGVPVESLLGA